jgi:hypothetical protein
VEYEERRKAKAFLHFPPLICSKLPVVSDRSPEAGVLIFKRSSIQVGIDLLVNKRALAC